MMECEKCTFKWKDASQYTVCDKVTRTLKQFRYGNYGILNIFHTLFLAKPCPKCGIMI